MSVVLQDGATYQLGDQSVVAGELDYGWWLLQVLGPGEVETWPTWSAGPDGCIYEGGVELKTGSPLTYSAVGPATTFNVADLVLLKEGPYEERRRQQQEQRKHPSAFRQMMDSLRNETSDRAVAIVGAAYLDDRLGQTLRAFFINRDKPTRELLSTQGPLGAFGARIHLAFCLGLLDEDEYHDLGTIQKIRNAFAHQTGSLSFEEPSIAQRCDRLQLLKNSSSAALYLSYSRRDRYITTVAAIIAALATAEFHATNDRRVVPEPRAWRRYGTKG